MSLWTKFLGTGAQETDVRGSARRRSQPWGDYLSRKRAELAQLSPHAGARVVGANDAMLPLVDQSLPASDLFNIIEDDEA